MTDTSALLKSLNDGCWLKVSSKRKNSNGALYYLKALPYSIEFYQTALLQNDNYNHIFKHTQHWNTMFNIFMLLGIHMALFKDRNSSLICFFLQHLPIWNHIVRHPYTYQRDIWKKTQTNFMKFRNILTFSRKEGPWSPLFVW